MVHIFSVNLRDAFYVRELNGPDNRNVKTPASSPAGANVGAATVRDVHKVPSSPAPATANVMGPVVRDVFVNTRNASYIQKHDDTDNAHPKGPSSSCPAPGNVGAAIVRVVSVIARYAFYVQE